MKSRIVNLENVPLLTISHGEKYESSFAPVGAHIESQHLGFNVTIVPPGKRAFPYHAHRGNEEMFFILEGEGSVRIHGDRAGQATRQVDADEPQPLADVRAPRPTGDARPAREQRIDDDQSPGLGAPSDAADELVADGEREGRSWMLTGDDVEIRPAQPGEQDADRDLTGTDGRRRDRAPGEGVRRRQEQDRTGVGHADLTTGGRDPRRAPG